MRYTSKHVDKANCQQMRACSLAPAAGCHDQFDFLELPVRDAICIGYTEGGAGSNGRGNGHVGRQQGVGGQAARGQVEVGRDWGRGCKQPGGGGDRCCWQKGGRGGIALGSLSLQTRTSFGIGDT